MGFSILSFPNPPIFRLLSVEILWVNFLDDFVTMRSPQVGGDWYHIDFKSGMKTYPVQLPLERTTPEFWQAIS